MAKGDKRDSSSQGNTGRKSKPASSTDRKSKEQAANGIPMWLGIVVAFLAIILGLVMPALLKREPPLPNPILLSKVDDAAEQRNLKEATEPEPGATTTVDGEALHQASDG